MQESETEHSPETPCVGQRVNTMSTATYEIWHDDHGTELSLTCDDRSCVVDLTMSEHWGDQVCVEVLQVAKDQRGLPRGSPVTLLRKLLKTSCSPHPQLRVASFALPPGWSQETALRCYFRVQPIADVERNSVSELGGADTNF